MSTQEKIKQMSNRLIAIKILEEKSEVTIKCNGGSMKPLIFPKEAIHLRRVNHSLIRVGDAVFCRINGNLQVHKVTAIDKGRYQISNNKNFVNGWVGANCIYGLCVKVEDRVLVSDAELQKRDAENDKPSADWKLNEEAIKAMYEAPILDLDAHLDGKVEEQKRIKAEVGVVERFICMDEVDLECQHCNGLTAHRFCDGKDLIHCVHCGNPMKTVECKRHKAKSGKQQVPRYSPYGHHGEVIKITEKDAKYLAGEPKPLNVVVPVKIEK